MTKSRTNLIVLLLLGLCQPVTDVFPQGLPPENLRDQAAVIEEKVKKEAEEAIREQREVSPEISPAEEEKPEKVPPREPEPSFFVKEIRLEGNTVVPLTELKRLTSPYENQDQTMTRLEKLTKAIEELYRGKGYITSTVYIPKQRLEGGILTIRIIEGKVGEFYVEGNRFFRKKRILDYSVIQKGEILHYQKLRKTLRRMNLNPDREVRAILRRGVETETTDIILKVRDRFPLHLGSTFDNQGTRSTGEQRFGFSLRNTNLTGLDDILSSGTIFGRDFGSVYTQYFFPIPKLNTRLISGFTHAQVSPKKNLQPFGANSTSSTYSIKLEQELFETGSADLNFDVGFDFKESRTKLLGGTFRRERLRVIRFGPTLRLEDPWGTTQLGSEFSFGLKGLGAAIHIDPKAARQGIDPDFFRIEGNFLRNQRMPFGTRFTVRTAFQIPAGKLPSSEAFYLGGASTVRGYPEGDYISDSGLFVSVEYFIPAFFIPEDWQLPYAKTSLRKQVELVLFADEGYGRLRGPSEKEVPSRNLFGLGGGLKIRLYDKLYARLEWAHALGNEPLTESNHTRFHFRLQVEV